MFCSAGIHSVTADSHTCTDNVLAEKKTTVDNAVTEIQTMFAPIIADPNTPMERKTPMILDMICNDTNTYVFTPPTSIVSLNKILFICFWHTQYVTFILDLWDRVENPKFIWNSLLGSQSP